jgi:hypothetical protein
MVITNFLAFAAGRACRQADKGFARRAQRSSIAGRDRAPCLPDLGGRKSIIVINDEAHHCYRASHPTSRREPAPNGAGKRRAAKADR